MDMELLHRQPGRAQEPIERLLRGADLGALAVLAQGRAFGGKPLDRQHQPPGRGKGAGMGIGQTALDQTVGDQLAQILGGAALHARGDFLGEEFDQDIGHGGTLVYRAGCGGQSAGTGSPSKASSPQWLICGQT
jgi:hypothetical protein